MLRASGSNRQNSDRNLLHFVMWPTVDPHSRPPRQRACTAARRVAGSLDIARPTHATQEHHDRRQHLQRSTPARPRGAGGGPQAPGHVHRVHRHPRPHALPLGDHRQRRGRGAGRCLRPDRGHAAPRRLRRGARPRARHPGRQGAQDRAVRGRGGLHQAARRRQVRRRRPTSRPAACTASAPRSSTRCPPGSTSRSTARRRSRACRFRRGVPGRLRRRRPRRVVPAPGRA